MQGTMMHYPLTLSHSLERAGKFFSNAEIVSRRPDHALHRYTYADLHRRASALAEALQRAGLERGDRVATLMWNHHAHLEAYFGIPISGGVLHTLNLRLAPSEIAYIANHAQDRFMSASYQLGAGAVVTQPLTLSSAHVDLTWKHLGLDSLESLIAAMRAAGQQQNASVPPAARAQSMMAALKQPLEALLLEQPEMDIDRVSVATAQGQGLVTGVIRLAGVSAADFSPSAAVAASRTENPCSSNPARRNRRICSSSSISRTVFFDLSIGGHQRSGGFHRASGKMNCHRRSETGAAARRALLRISAQRHECLRRRPAQQQSRHAGLHEVAHRKRARRHGEISGGVVTAVLISLHHDPSLLDHVGPAREIG